MDFLVKHRPSVLFFNHPELLGRDEGTIKTIHEVFVKKMGYSEEFLRTLVVKYPAIIGKNEAHINEFYRIMKENGID